MRLYLSAEQKACLERKRGLYSFEHFPARQTVPSLSYLSVSLRAIWFEWLELFMPDFPSKPSPTLLPPDKGSASPTSCVFAAELSFGYCKLAY